MSGGLRSLVREARGLNGMPRAIPWPAGERPLQSFLGTRKATRGVMREVWAELHRYQYEHRSALSAWIAAVAKKIGMRKARRGPPRGR